MSAEILSLKNIIDINALQRVQDDISTATDFAVLTVDFKGSPLTEHSNCSQLCKRIRSNSTLNKMCQKCDSRGGLEAARIRGPYVYLCHAGIVEFAIPIIINHQYYGAVVGGQVLVEEDDGLLLEHIISKDVQAAENIERRKMEELYNLLPILTLSKIKAVTVMIYSMIDHMFGEGMIQINPGDESVRKNTYVDSIRINVGNEISSNGNEINPSGYRYRNIIVPVISYIHENYCNNVKLADVSSKCNISASYLSKLFYKEMGLHFSQYINMLRIEKAKKLLKNSELQISNISSVAGFDDCGYFIKVFKKNEGITPLAYRMSVEQDSLVLKSIRC